MKGIDKSLRGAVIDGPYRYRLWRYWDRELIPLVVCMLNPSTADDVKNDQTIRRCLHYAKREGFGGLEVVNLFAWRSTDPDVLRKAAVSQFARMIGPSNDDHIRNALKATRADTGGLVLVAWGTNVERISGGMTRARQVKRLIDEHGLPIVCLGTTQGGYPRHPARLGNDVELVPYEF